VATVGSSVAIVVVIVVTAIVEIVVLVVKMVSFVAVMVVPVIVVVLPVVMVPTVTVSVAEIVGDSVAVGSCPGASDKNLPLSEAPAFTPPPAIKMDPSCASG